MKLRRRKLAFKTRVAQAVGFPFQDVGNVGWEFPTYTTTAPTGTTSALRLAATNVGSRIYYIRPSKPLVTTQLAADQDGRVYWFNGTNIIDENGSTTNPGNGLAYGTNVLLPNEDAIRPFKRWAYVGSRRGNGSTDYGTVQQTIGSSALDAFRYGFPDWWLIRRGDILDQYDDLRSFYDDVGQSTWTTAGGGGSVGTASGKSATERAICGVYGPVSDGRAEIRHPTTQFMGAYVTLKYSTYFGFRLNGSVRDPALRPVDWNSEPANDVRTESSIQASSLGSLFNDVLFEDIHIDQTGGNFAWQWVESFVTPTLEPGLRLNRMLFTDSWDENRSSAADARRNSADGNQTWSGGTTTALTFVSAGSANTAAMNLATGTLTTAASTYYRVWYLLDLQATVPVNGSIEVRLFRNGVEVAGAFPNTAFADKTIVGTGVASDLYQLHGVVYSPKCNLNDTLDVRVRTVNGTGTVTALAGACKLQINVVSTGTGGNGIYTNASKGSKLSLNQLILFRNGFNTPEPGVIPDGIMRRDWDIRNHNFYLNGKAAPSNYTVVDSVSLLGAAGDVIRSNLEASKSFFYNGYVGVTPHSADGIAGGLWNDNVFQRYKASAGVFTSHPGWGMSVENGLNSFQIKRNIISDVMLLIQGASSNGSPIGVGGTVTPYGKNGEMKWTADMVNTVIDGNIIDAATNTAYAAVTEYNGASTTLVQWQSVLTGTVAAGAVQTCTPTAGWTSGTPTYQWTRWPADSLAGVDISGATAATYTLLDYGRVHLGAAANAAAMTALSTATIGDVCYRSDINSIYELTAANPAVAGNWVNYFATNAIARNNLGRIASTAAMNALTPVVGDYCLRTDMAAWAEYKAGGWVLLYSKTWIDFRYLIVGATIGTFLMVTCAVKGIVYPAGVGITGTVVSNNIMIKSAVTPTLSYVLLGIPPTYGTEPVTSSATLTTNSTYATLAAAGVALGWSNPNASLKTYMQSLGITVTSADGLDEYCATVMGNNIIKTAMRYGQWDDRFLGRKMGNHVRAGRGMAAVA